MPLDRRIACALTFAGVLAATPVGASTVLFQDGDFFRSWDYLPPINTKPTAVLPETVTPGAPGTAYHNNVLSGGNPGAYVEHVIEDFKWGERITHIAIFTGEPPVVTPPIYDPATQGPIAAIDFRADVKVSYDTSGFHPDSEPLTMFHFVVMQGGEVFYTTRRRAEFEDWTAIERLDLTAASFSTNPLREVFGQGAPVPDSFVDQADGVFPDFSENGLPLSFGYAVSSTFAGLVAADSSALPQIGTAFFGVDNWQVSITPVPVPAALPLFASALVGLAWWRRRSTAA